MILRNYFFKFESMPRLINDRRSAGKDTMCTGFIECRSFFVKPEYVSEFAKKKAIEIVPYFKENEIILTQFSRC